VFDLLERVKNSGPPEKTPEKSKHPLGKIREINP
jgi:hypothetical protein